jgi:TRAP-type C4-dicarboxylate transport system permease small subunit
VPVGSKLLAFVRRVEEALLAILLAAMIFVAAAQVVLRNFFEGGIYWGDSAVRVMVLWVALLGAMVASRRDEHIRIDIAGRFLPAHLKPHVSRVVSLFTCVVLCIFTWYSIDFVRYEYEDGTLAFAQVPAWVCEAIMPFGAGVMALRYGLLTIWPQQGAAR